MSSLHVSASIGFPLHQDAFSQVLDVLRVRGTTVALGNVPPSQSLQIACSAPCLYVPQSEGRFTLRVSGAETQTIANAGDVVLLVHGSAHILSCSAAAGDHATSGADGSQCGFLHGNFVFDGAFVGNFLKMLPDVIVLARKPGDSHQWIDLACAFIVEEAKQGKAGAAAMISRLLDLLFIRSLRTWATEADGGHGWLSGAVDERLGRVLAAMHQDPFRSWSVKELAEFGAMSRTAFSNRFLAVVGQTPMAYLTAWRLDRAAELLRQPGIAVSAVAERMGYMSDAAFIRAFRQRHGLSPLQWRKANR